MSLTLSQSELAMLRRTLALFAFPHTPLSPSEWHAEVLAAVRPLLGDRARDIFDAEQPVEGVPAESREDAILSLLRFVAADAWRRVRQSADRHDAIARLLESSSDGVALYDSNGSLVLANPRLSRILAQSTGSATLTAAMRRLVFAASAWSDRTRPHRTTASVTLAGVKYSVRADDAGLALDYPAAILVRVKREHSRLPSLDSLMTRLSLTRREAQIALLLARGATNKEIVAHLHVSEFTARRHTEKVLRKLSLDSRAKVAAVILGTADEEATEQRHLA